MRTDISDILAGQPVEQSTFTHTSAAEQPDNQRPDLVGKQRLCGLQVDREKT